MFFLNNVAEKPLDYCRFHEYNITESFLRNRILLPGEKNKTKQYYPKQGHPVNKTRFKIKI